MQNKKIIWLVLLVLTAIALTSCNIGKAPEPTPDVNAIYTTVAQTMVSQFNDQMTQTAQAIPPTFTPSPIPPTFTPSPTAQAGSTAFVVFNTPIPGLPTATLIAPVVGGTPRSTANGCNNAAFTGETIPDGTTMTKGKSFTKSWNFQNNGTCDWVKGYQFVYVSGDKMSGNNVVFGTADIVKVGHGTAFNVKMVAPSAAGTYKGNWQMKDASGNFFGPIVWVKIIVQ
jgi:hypothetical protein